MTKIVFVGTRVSDLSNTWGVAGNDIYSNYSGNVGIGTSAPTTLLDVSGHAKVSGNVTICGSVIANSISGTLSTASQPNITSVGTLSSLNVSGNSTTTGTSQLTGNVGIGKSASATYSVDVSGNINMSGDLYKNGVLFTGGGGGGSSQWTTAGSEIYYQGNVGIGTGMTNPAYALDVSGDIRANTIFANTIDTTSNITIDISNIDGLIQFGSNNTMVIDPTLNRVGIGKEGPNKTLDVAGDVAVLGSFDVSGNVNIDSGLIFANGTTNRVGINNANPTAVLDVSGNAVVSGNLNVDSTTLVVDALNNRIGICKASPSVALDVSGSTTVSGNLAIGKSSATETLDVSGNVNIDSGLIFANGTTNRVGINNANPTAVLDVSGNVVVSGNLNVNSAITIGSNSVQRMFIDTAKTTTSGTSAEFTGIPSWAKKITIILNEVSTNGNNDILIQIGSGSYETSGYLSTFCAITGANACSVASSTIGYLLNSGSGGNVASGHLTITPVSGNTWIGSGTVKTTGSRVGNLAGSKTISGTLDRIRIATTSTDQFDNGSVNILIEGY
jgi:hypothetical protein